LSGYVRLNRGFTTSNMVATTPSIGHRSYLRRAIPRRRNPAKRLNGARMHARKRIQAQSMRNLTLGCSRWSAMVVMAGEELKVADSGDGRPGEMRRFRRLRPSRLDSSRRWGMLRVVKMRVAAAVLGNAPDGGDRWWPERAVFGRGRI
jgi:hypothetical protein